MKSTELLNKYIVSRSDGSPMPENFNGFVLRLDSGGDKDHVSASRHALYHYAHSMACSDDQDKKEFGKNLKNMLRNLDQEQPLGD